jgi:hypothetical protein
VAEADAAFVIHDRNGNAFSQPFQLLSTICFTTICWIAAAYLAPGTDEERLVDFYTKVRPSGPGWKRVRRTAEARAHIPEPSPDNLPLSLIG